jgi:integrase
VVRRNFWAGGANIAWPVLLGCVTPSHDPVATAFLMVETTRTGEPTWAVKWRGADGTRRRRRLGAHAWVDREDAGGWRPRDGRPTAGWLTEFQARRRVASFIEAAEAERARTAAESVCEPAARAPTFRELAHAWLEHVEFVQRAKPSTIRDYRAMLAEPGVPYRRGRGKTLGRIMAAFGDVAAADVTAAQIDALLVVHAREGAGPRSVNKHRQVLSAIFNFGLRPENAADWKLSDNPAAAVAKRREDGPARLEVFTVEQVEALARTAASGAWRGPHDDLADAGELVRAEEDAQLAELIRVAAYTGLRRGELVALRWRDIRWSERVLVVERALSGDVESTTKGRRVRYVPLGDQALGALDRLSRRANFTSADDYVFAGVAGDRLDPSALRRRYLGARDAAGLPPLRFHDLRHTAGTLLTRVLDPVTVRDVLGHADLKTTERYLHAVRASRLADAATRAFAPSAPDGRTAAAREALRVAVEQLGPEEARRILDGVG